jgi:hypothetical protein
MSLTLRWAAALLWMAAAVTTAPGGANPQFTGFVTLIERGTGKGDARVTVESHANKMVRRHVLTVTPQTAIVKRTGEVETPASLDSLAVKNWVRVWFAGGEKNSYPVEVTARRIIIVDRL